jgi:hypothetical protein
MARKPHKLRPDVAEVAFRVFQEAVGEAPRTVPPAERATRNREAVRLGSIGGKKGGAARKKSLTRAERSNIAREAAKSRWARNKEG